MVQPPTEQSEAPYFTTWVRQQLVDRFGARRGAAGEQAGDLCGEALAGGFGIEAPSGDKKDYGEHLRALSITGDARVGVQLLLPLHQGLGEMQQLAIGVGDLKRVLGNVKTLARLFSLPYFPITPTFPLLGPLGLIPLPSKWIIEFGSPVATADLGPNAADDPMLVFDLTDQVRETIQQTLYSLLMQRRSVFF